MMMKLFQISAMLAAAGIQTEPRQATSAVVLRDSRSGFPPPRE
jgi:hypothetical protein